MNADDILVLVRDETDLVRDPTVRAGLSRILVRPTFRRLAWDYGRAGETYPAWMVAEHPETDTGIAWCGHGFGPKTPWGLVGLTTDSMGMDCGWFSTLRDAYVDSMAALDLEIWVVVRRGDWAAERPLSHASTSEVASRLLDERPDAESCTSWPGAGRTIELPEAVAVRRFAYDATTSIGRQWPDIGATPLERKPTRTSRALSGCCRRSGSPSRTRCRPVRIIERDGAVPRHRDGQSRIFQSPVPVWILVQMTDDIARGDDVAKVRVHPRFDARGCEPPEQPRNEVTYQVQVSKRIGVFDEPRVEIRPIDGRLRGDDIQRQQL